MKKIKIMLVLFALAGAVGAKTLQKLDPLYFFNPTSGLMEEITTPGDCEPTELEIYCEYAHIPNTPNNGDPENYQPATTVFKQRWVPEEPAK